MTDKEKRSEVLTCKAAGKKLYAQLQKDGVNLTGIGVGFGDDNQGLVINVYVSSEDDTVNVPNMFDNFHVKTIVTGTIKAGL